MTSDNAADPSLPTFAAQPRAVRLKEKPVISGEEKRVRPEKPVTPVEVSRLEQKLAGLHDAQQMLHVMNTELALQRSARLHGGDGKSRQAMRVLSVTILFALLIAALAAMGWLQSRMAQTGISRHRAEVRGQR